MDCINCVYAKFKTEVSILVLLDLPFGQQYHSPTPQNYYYVSILVLLDLPFGRMKEADTTRQTHRFNPCFVGSAFWTILMLIVLLLGDRVSILVLLDLPFGHDIVKPYCALHANVSILVLLDLPFGPRANDCAQTKFLEFQSLFCWICLLDFYNHIYWYEDKRFQSLFCWICLLDFGIQKRFACKVYVSILVLLDLPFGRYGPCHQLFVTRKFQSLFCWICLLDSRQVYTNRIERIMEFQSLFCWICLLDNNADTNGAK